MTAPKTAPAAEPLLPNLRRDIRFEDGGRDANGLPITLFIDPLRGSYFRVSWPASGYLACWSDNMPVSILAARAGQRFGLSLTTGDLDLLIKFLFNSQLTQLDENNSWGRYDMMVKAGQHSVLMSLVHNYLFFRVPLLRPDAALKRLLPYLSFIYTKGFFIGYLAMVAIGLYLTSREWGAFEAMFWRMAKLQSIMLYAVVLLCLKAIHELGHALTTVKYGCRVPSVGLALMLGAPVFYTDTTDAWRLTRRSQRLAIVVAGVAAEFIVAGAAIFLWPFLPDGLAREVCFAITTSALVTSLLVNMNPCMRFDGYFAFSDILDIPNVQTHAFGLAKWKLREILFNLGRPPPEDFSPRMRATLVIYAWCVWFYRFFLFIGIAAVVYAMAVKVLGILLGLFEIIMFVLKPIVKEIGEWAEMRQEIFKSRRSRISAAGLAAALGLLFLPWVSIVEAPAVLASSNEGLVYARMPGRIKSVHVKDGQSVTAGDILLDMDAPELEAQKLKAQFELQSAETQLGRINSFEKDMPSRLVIEQQVNRAQERLKAIKRMSENLVVRAPMNGIVADLDTNAKPGVWLGMKTELGRIISTEGVRVKAVVGEADLNRLKEGAAANFVPDDLHVSTTALHLVGISPVNQTNLTELALADLYGGQVPVSEDHGKLLPRNAIFEVMLEGDEQPPTAMQRGIVRISADATSPFMSLQRQVARVLIREQGF